MQKFLIGATAGAMLLASVGTAFASNKAIVVENSITVSANTG